MLNWILSFILLWFNKLNNYGFAIFPKMNIDMVKIVQTWAND